MNRIFWGKIIGLVAPLMLGKSITIAIGGVCLGHLFDEAYPYIRVYLLKNVLRKSSYQKVSEEFLFLTAYFITFIGLPAKKVFKLLQTECKIEKGSEKNVEDVFFYYIDEYLIKHGRNSLFLGKRITKALQTVKFSEEDRLNFFIMIKAIFDSLVAIPTARDIEKMKRIAEILEIDYLKEEKSYQHQYQYSYTQRASSDRSDARNYEKQQNSSYTKSTSSNASRGYNNLTLDVKKAFKIFGFKEDEINSMTLPRVKKVYKDSVKKYHPDFVNGEKISEKDKKYAEHKLVELNKSMELVKKYLAKR